MLLPFFRLSTHAVNRFVERFPKIISSKPVDIPPKSFIVKYINENAVNKAHIKNNTSFMSYLYHKYGFNRNYEFYVVDDAVFVCDALRDREKPTVVVVTVLDKKSDKYNIF